MFGSISEVEQYDISNKLVMLAFPETSYFDKQEETEASMKQVEAIVC